jgi:aldose 1-epimerase
MTPEIDTITLERGGLKVTVLSMGASLFDLSLDLPSGQRRVILQLPGPEDYRTNRHYLGVIAGRCANRIRGGDAVIGGRHFQLDRNEKGKTHLHGGTLGFSRRNWNVSRQDDASVELTLESPDGDMGYPGTVRAQCRYDILDGQRLRITLSAVSDADTLVNLAAHGYFNLEPGSSILDHHLKIAADAYTPVDHDLIPDGRIAPVDGTAFDFRSAKAIGSERSGSPQGYDHSFVWARAPRSGPVHAATLIAPDGSLAMEIHTTEPGLQFYDGQMLTPDPSDARGELRLFGACCLEPQRFPDAVHHPDFASSVLRAGETYRQVTEYRFRAAPFRGSSVSQ